MEPKIVEETIILGKDIYNIRAELFADGDLDVSIIDMITKNKFACNKTAKDILELTRGKLNLDSNYFYYLLEIGLRNGGEHIKIDYKPSEENFILEINWKLPIKDELYVQNQISLIVDKIAQSEVSRMELMMLDLFDVDKRIRGSEVVIRSQLEELMSKVINVENKYVEQKSAIESIGNEIKNAADCKINSITAALGSIKNEFESIRAEYVKLKSEIDLLRAEVRSKAAN